MTILIINDIIDFVNRENVKCWGEFLTLGNETGVKELVRFIDEERVRQNLSERELAKLSDMSNATINRMLSGDDVPSTDSIEKIARGLGYSVVALLMLAVKSNSGFEDVQLIELFQSLSPRGRAILLETARAIARNDTKTP